MINKLYKLKQSQLDQQYMLKQKLISQIANIDEKFNEIQKSINEITVDRFGAISDFTILAIHKETMKYEQQKLNMKKFQLQQEIQKYDKIIVHYQKEVEKYGYLLQQEKKAKLQAELKYEEAVRDDFVQAQYNDVGVAV